MKVNVRATQVDCIIQKHALNLNSRFRFLYSMLFLIRTFNPTTELGVKFAKFFVVWTQSESTVCVRLFLRKETCAKIVLKKFFFVQLQNETISLTPKFCKSWKFSGCYHQFLRSPSTRQVETR